ncbi:hypothetical protein Amal_03667 [Acetobacter malorum]|uniref:Uncharacterized protein n=1 Tax=Acetobacter malorum TaxID=178901 RepID=A0A177G737_9PROT|nr:hypothetical protein Amal_03667 [Acetobacter malorum]
MRGIALLLVQSIPRNRLNGDGMQTIHSTCRSKHSTGRKKTCGGCKSLRQYKAGGNPAHPSVSQHGLSATPCIMRHHGMARLFFASFRRADKEKGDGPAKQNRFPFPCFFLTK